MTLHITNIKPKGRILRSKKGTIRRANDAKVKKGLEIAAALRVDRKELNELQRLATNVNTSPNAGLSEQALAEFKQYFSKLFGDS